MFFTLSQVALGGALGASLRYLTNVSAMRMFGPNLPYATLIVNVLGSLLMGVLIVTLAKKGGTHLAPFLMTGILGGFTTFSAFSLDVFTLWERGDTLTAVGYIAASLILSLAALAAGVYLSREIFA